jgi:hypothetical protein
MLSHYDVESERPVCAWIWVDPEQSQDVSKENKMLHAIPI